jgi:hypothetical protein
LQVEVEESEEAGDQPCLLVKLWRADMLAAVMEVNSSCGVVKADLAGCLLFGMHQQQLQAAGLCRCDACWPFAPPSLAAGSPAQIPWHMACSLKM